MFDWREKIWPVSMWLLGKAILHSGRKTKFKTKWFSCDYVLRFKYYGIAFRESDSCK